MASALALWDRVTYWCCIFRMSSEAWFCLSLRKWSSSFIEGPLGDLDREVLYSIGWSTVGRIVTGGAKVEGEKDDDVPIQLEIASMPVNQSDPSALATGPGEEGIADDAPNTGALETLKFRKSGGDSKGTEPELPPSSSRATAPWFVNVAQAGMGWFPPSATGQGSGDSGADARRRSRGRSASQACVRTDRAGILVCQSQRHRPRKSSASLAMELEGIIRLHL
mmetsp:Transcript_10521/g.23529  ORF Transcript_10521/g.23529 Transcript_10521/m.23529 type:complete len:223 (-) Transcript_10521:511-1179(-)